MKLLRLHIKNSFRSLPAGFKIEFRKAGEDLNINLSEPICLVGVNGSGKSNVLEALAEIFSYIDQTFLKFVNKHSDSPIINSFELDYLIPFNANKRFFTSDGKKVVESQFVQIKIIKKKDLKPSFYRISNGKKHSIIDNYIDILPDKVIGYSSGQNELLSIPFRRVQFRYYNTLLQEQKDIYKESVEYSRLKYINYEESGNIILALYLMSSKDELKTLNDTIETDGIASFEITINRNQKKKDALTIDKDIERLLNFFESNAKKVITLKEGIKNLKFEVNKTLKDEFKDNFLDSAGLYKLLKKLTNLNLNTVDQAEVNLFLSSDEEAYINYNIRDLKPKEELFQISKINVSKIGKKSPISYRGLSDGEHQFINVIGALMMMKDESTLFLFDEPETHFNPRWKYEYTETFKKVSDAIKSQILLTTHDPVLISGLAKENVIVFNKPQKGVERTHKPDKDLRGMGVDAILMSEIFGFDSTLDIATKEKVIELRVLQLKRLSSQLSVEEQTRYSILYEKLRGIDFAEPLNDPMYRDFLIAKESLSVYSKPFLTKDEEKEREDVSKQILEKIKAKFDQ